MSQNFHVPSLIPTYCGRRIALTPPEVCNGAMPFANQHYSGGVTKALGNQHQSFLAIVVPCLSQLGQYKLIEALL